jgi:ZIP family zinc transporter
MYPDLLLGALAVLAATALGASGVVLFRRVGMHLYPAIIAFCAGMMAFSAFEMADASHALTGHRMAFVSLVGGMLAFVILDRVLPHAHTIICGRSMPEAKRKATLLVGTITLHNIPEGFAIASAFATSPELGWLVTSSIALQDIPEGLIVAAPMACYGVVTKRSFLWGAFSGVIEAAAAIAGYFLLQVLASAAPLSLGFSAGAMTYVIVSELLPDALQSGNRTLALSSFAAGMAAAVGIAILLGQS